MDENAAAGLAIFRFVKEEAGTLFEALAQDEKFGCGREMLRVIIEKTSPASSQRDEDGSIRIEEAGLEMLQRLRKWLVQATATDFTVGRIATRPVEQALVHLC